MAEYVCKIADSTGRVFEQVETALSENEARHRLSERGFYVYSINRNLGLASRFRRSGSSRLVRGQDFLIFNQQFNTLIKAGLPILTALDLLAERAAAPRLRPLLADVRERVRTGALLSEALVAQAVFPPVYTTSVMAGEKSGSLSTVLDQYIAYQKTTSSFFSRLKNVLIYPSILIVMVVVVLSYLVTFAVPRFAELYKELNVQLPTITRIVLAISLPLREYIFFVMAGLAIVGTLTFLWARSEAGALIIDRFKPRIPVIGNIWLKAQIAQFVRTLSTLLAGGSPLVNALDTSADAMGSKLISTSVRKAVAQVREGTPLHTALLETHVMPDLALEMIEVGEASGALAPMLTSVAEFYEQEVDLKLTAILAWVEPAILVIMAAVIAFILIALYLPMFSLTAGTVQGYIRMSATTHRGPAPPVQPDAAAEAERSKLLAQRYRCSFIDLRDQRIDPELFRSIPAELMFRYNFVPLEAHDHSLAIAVSDPSQVLVNDELSLLLGKKLQIKVATATQIGDILKRTEQSQRVLDQATEGFTLQVVDVDEESEENITMEKLTRDTGVSPVVRLVDTVIFTALERRASDIHIETGNTEVVVK